MAEVRKIDETKGIVESPETEKEMEIDLMELFYRLLDNLKYILAVALIGAVIAGIWTIAFIAPTYEATAKLYVTNSEDSAVNLSDLQIGTYLASDYQEIFKTWEVHEMVTQNLNLQYSYRELEDMLSITNPSDTRILYITVTSENPQEAANIANEYASVAKKYISETMSTEEPNILSTATVPNQPVGPSKVKNVLLGFMLGLVLSCGVVVVRFILDDKIKTSEDVRKYADLPVLAVVPASGRSGNGTGGTRRAAPAKRQER